MTQTTYATDGEQLTIVGTRIEPWHTTISRTRQAAYNAASDVDPTVFSDTVDASILANDAILATRYLKTNAQDGLHAGQRLQQFAPLQFDEPLTLHGTIVEAKPVSKGSIITTRFDVTRPDGSVPVVTDIISLRINYDTMKSEGGGGSTGKTATGLTLLSEKPLSPEKVAAYSFEFPDYKVHFDPDLAASIGLRAPIAQGAMSVSWIAGEIAKGGAIDTLDMSVTFRQPIFWDEHVKVYAQDAENFAIANSADEICSMGNLQSVTYQA